MKRTSILTNPHVEQEIFGGKPAVPIMTKVQNEPEMAEVAKTMPKLKKSKAKSKMVLNLLFITFVLGLLYGAILIRENLTTFFDSMSIINETDITQRQTGSMFDTFLQSFMSSTVFFTVILLMGFSAIGQPATFLVIFIKGLGIGSSVGYMYINHAVTGLLYSILIIVVPTVIGTLSLIMLAKESAKLSNMIFLGFVRDGHKVSRYTLKLYLYKSAVFYALILVAAVVDAVMTFLFLSLFNFS